MAAGVQDSDGFPGSLTSKGTPTTSDLVKIADEAASGVAKQATIGSLPFVQLAGGTMTGLLVLSGDPSNALGAVTKQYADAISAGLDVKDPVLAATTGSSLTVTYNNGVSGVGATLTNAGSMAAFSIDGQSPTVGQRVLIKDQSSTYENGIYSVTVIGSGAVNWVLTRTTDYDAAPSQIFPGNLIIVTAGTVNANTSWLQTAAVAAVGSGNPITFIQFSSTPLSLPLGVTSGGTGLGSTTANQLLYSSATNTIAGLATAANSVVATNGSGVPALTTTMPTAVQVGVNSLNSGTSASSSTFWRGDGSWSTPTSTSGLTWLASVTASNSATVTFSGKLSATYDNYLLTFEDVFTQTNAVTIIAQVGTGAGPSYSTSTYVNVPSTTTNGFDLTQAANTFQNTTAHRVLGGFGLLNNANNSSDYKSWNSLTSYYQNAGSVLIQNYEGSQWQTATVLTSIQFLASSGNLTTGTFKLYGIQN